MHFPYRSEQTEGDCVAVGICFVRHTLKHGSNQRLPIRIEKIMSEEKLWHITSHIWHARECVDVYAFDLAVDWGARVFNLQIEYEKKTIKFESAKAHVAIDNN